MFSRMQLLSTVTEITQRFDVTFLGEVSFQPSEVISAFDHLPHPIITSQSPNVADCNYRWGLIPPDWNKSPAQIWNHTISAKLEYLDKRYSWKQISNNRCLIPATAYYEFHWNDVKGKSKTRYTIRSTNSTLFSLAGLYSKWNAGNQTLHTFAVCTTNANEIMQFVHNKDAAKNYHRMPIMLNAGHERDWLDTGIHYLDFAFPNYRPNLIAEPDLGLQGMLF